VYLTFYGLQEKPFGMTPDPRFLVLAPSHREALAQLVYGVQEKKGFLVLTGEIGSGKTTLIHTLLRRLDSDTAAAFIFNSTLPFDDLLEYALEDFGAPRTGASHAQRLIALNAFLIERRRAGLNTVLIVDEAQNLSPQTLEQVRLLSNFETPTDKLLQILLVGQPELGDRLALPALRQLKQRIALRCRIEPLTADEVAEYVRARLRIAGARDTGLFTAEALGRIAQHAGGIPRIVNSLCDHALLIGYADQHRRIDRRIVEEAIRYLEAGEPPEPRPIPRGRRPRGRGRMRPARLPRWAVLGGAVAAGAAVALVLVPALTLWPEAFHGVMSPLTELAARLRDLVGR
jgi:general secretion pathway protein A